MSCIVNCKIKVNNCYDLLLLKKIYDLIRLKIKGIESLPQTQLDGVNL